MCTTLLKIYAGHLKHIGGPQADREPRDEVPWSTRVIQGTRPYMVQKFKRWSPTLGSAWMLVHNTPEVEATYANDIIAKTRTNVHKKDVRDYGEYLLTSSSE